MLSSFDVDRQVSQVSRKTWSQVLESHRDTNMQNESSSQPVVVNISHLERFAIQAIMDPIALYQSFYPILAPVEFTPSQARGGKRPPAAPQPAPKSSEDIDRKPSSEEEESQPDKEARLRAAGLGALRWLIGQLSFLLTATIPPAPIDACTYCLGDPVFTLYCADRNADLESKNPDEENEITALLTSPEFWSILCPVESSPLVAAVRDITSRFHPFGYNQTGVRRAGWLLVQQLAQHPSRRYKLVPYHFYCLSHQQ